MHPKPSHILQGLHSGHIFGNALHFQKHINCLFPFPYALGIEFHMFTIHGASLRLVDNASSDEKLLVRRTLLCH